MTGWRSVWRVRESRSGWDLIRPSCASSCGSAALQRVEDLDGEAIRARYFSGRTDGLTVRGGLGRLACAWRE